MKATYFQEESWIYPFVMRHPEEMKENLPLIVLLHGAGERGNGKDQLSLVETHGFSHILTEDSHYDCLLVQPQCKEGSFWVADIPSVLAFIEQVAEAFHVDRSRISLTGISMGGFGTWYTAMAKPDLFAAIAPCCGGGMPWNAGVLTMPVWAFHGAIDSVVNVRESIEMIENLKNTNPDAHLTVFENVDHDSWTHAYTEELLHWLLSKHK